MNTIRTIKALSLTILLAAAFSLSSCDKITTDQINKEKPSMNVDIRQQNGRTFTIENGSCKFSYTVGNGETGEMTFNIEKQSGSIDVLVYPIMDRTHPIFRGTNISSSKFTVVFEKAGEYEIWFYCRDFVGEHKTDWRICKDNGIRVN